MLLFHLKDITSKQQTAYVWTTQSDEFQPVKIIIIKMGNLSITSKSLLLPFCNPPLSYAPPQCFFHLQATTDLLSVTIDQFAFSRILYTWNYTLCIYFCLASFTHCNDFAIHSWCFIVMDWRRKWQPTPVLLPGKSHGQRSLVSYSPWGRKYINSSLFFKHWTVFLCIDDLQFVYPFTC